MTGNDIKTHEIIINPETVTFTVKFLVCYTQRMYKYGHTKEIVHICCCLLEIYPITRLLFFNIARNISGKIGSKF